MATITIKRRRNPDDDWGPQGSHVCEDCGHNEVAVVYEGSDHGWYCEDCICRHLTAIDLTEDDGLECYDCGDKSDEQLFEGYSVKWDNDSMKFRYTPHWYCSCCVKEHIDRDEDDFESEDF